MLDGLEIPQVLGERYLNDLVDHTTAARRSRQPSTQLPSHVTAGILAAAYPETPVVIDINPSTFIMTKLEEEEKKPLQQPSWIFNYILHKPRQVSKQI